MEAVVTKIARYRVKKKKLPQAKKAIGEFIEEMKKNEPGISHYEVFQEKNEPASFVHVIKFKDRMAERIHEKSAHVQKLKKALYPICKKEPEFTYLKIVDSIKEPRTKPAPDTTGSQRTQQ